jgi:hypothetical protein
LAQSARSSRDAASQRPATSEIVAIGEFKAEAGSPFNSRLCRWYTFLLSSISDGWQITIPGSEAPGTYLVLAPGQQAPDDVNGYTVRHSPTFNIFLGARLTDEDPASAQQTLAQVKMYPYAQRDSPPPMDILDVGTRAWSGVPPRGMEYWQRLNDVIQREPVEPRDVFFHARR